MFFTLRRSRHTISFFAEIPRVNLRSHHMPSFFTKNPQVKWQRGHATQFPFSPKICESKWQRGRATSFPFSLKIRESAPFALRLRHTPSFFTKNPQVGTFGCTQLPFLLTPTWLGDSGIASKGTPHGATPAKPQAKRKKHASNM